MIIELRTSMDTYFNISVRSGVVAALWVFFNLPFAAAAQAANGTWTNTSSGGLWSGTGNWSGGTVADGSGNAADFNTVDHYCPVKVFMTPISAP
jgi:hypothetical protein